MACTGLSVVLFPEVVSSPITNFTSGDSQGCLTKN